MDVCHQNHKMSRQTKYFQVMADHVWSSSKNLSVITTKSGGLQNCNGHRADPLCDTWNLHVVYLTNSVLSVHLFCIMDESQAQQQALLFVALWALVTTSAQLFSPVTMQTGSDEALSGKLWIRPVATPHFLHHINQLCIVTDE